ncbi:MAG: CRISPR-associated endonuclease Cas2 [Proteobacteria bacterium]|nr:CRISPR-associated endonuclease Cas2 [Pseudomonadota bacterium]
MNLYLVHYHAQTPNRRRRLKTLLRAFGWEPEPGLFECPLSPAQARELERRIEFILKPGDRVRFYKLCSRCVEQSRQSGGADIIREHDPWIF